MRGAATYFFNGSGDTDSKISNGGPGGSADFQRGVPAVTVHGAWWLPPYHSLTLQRGAVWWRLCTSCTLQETRGPYRGYGGGGYPQKLQVNNLAPIGPVPPQAMTDNARHGVWRHRALPHAVRPSIVFLHTCTLGPKSIWVNNQHVPTHIVWPGQESGARSRKAGWPPCGAPGVQCRVFCVTCRQPIPSVGAQGPGAGWLTNEAP